MLGAVIGIWPTLSRTSAVVQDDRTEALGEVPYGMDISALGWFWLIIGARQVLTSYLIFQRRGLDNVFGSIWAITAARAAAVMVFVAPIWALVVVGRSIGCAGALLGLAEEFDWPLRGQRAAEPRQ